MREIHAFANGDGTYTIDMITVVDGVPKRYQIQNARIRMEDVVADEAPDSQPFVQFTVNSNFG